MDLWLKTPVQPTPVHGQTRFDKVHALYMNAVKQTALWNGGKCLKCFIKDSEEVRGCRSASKASGLISSVHDRFSNVRPESLFRPEYMYTICINTQACTFIQILSQFALTLTCLCLQYYHYMHS